MPSASCDIPVTKIRPESHERLTGVTAKICYDNPDFISAARAMFHARPNERIVQLEIDDDGITARFEIAATD